MGKAMQKELARRREEEERLRFPRFSNREALELGLKIIEKAEQRGAAVAVDITVNGTQLFHYAMKGTNKRHAMWIQRKQNTVQVAQISSLTQDNSLPARGRTFGRIGGSAMQTMPSSAVGSRSLWRARASSARWPAPAFRMRRITACWWMRSATCWEWIWGKRKIDTRRGCPKRWRRMMEV